MYASEQGILNEQLNAATTALNAAMDAAANEVLKRKLLIVSLLKPEFGKDGDQYFYMLGSLPDKGCIVGFGDTPMKALDEFCKAYGL